MNKVILILIASIIIGCNPSSPAKEESKPKTVFSKEIGWSITIPNGYQSMSETRVQANEQKGKDAIEDAFGEKVETKGLIHLVNFQKNQFNSLQATLQPYDEAKDGNYEQSAELTKKAIYDTYVSQKIKIDTSSTQKNYAGKAFHVFNISIYGPNGEVIMKQAMISRLEQGYDFGVNINYNNSVDEKALFEALANSKFSKP